MRRRSKTKEYQAWKSMRDRCTRTKHASYHRYGGRGITVCERWMNSFENFLCDMGPAPSAAHTLDRIDNDGGYTPDNCRWADWLTQERNKSRPEYTYQGKTQTLDLWAAELGMNYFALHYRLVRMKWSPERAFSTPIVEREITERFVTFQGKTKPLKQWTDELGLDYTRIYQRIYKRGWPVERALTEPIRRYGSGSE